MRKVGNAAGDLARFLLLLKVGMTHKASLLAFSTSTFIVRWVWPGDNIYRNNEWNTQGRWKTTHQSGSCMRSMNMLLLPEPFSTRTSSSFSSINCFFSVSQAG
jgi:hypothetical protein